MYFKVSNMHEPSNKILSIQYTKYGTVPKKFKKLEVITINVIFLLAIIFCDFLRVPSLIKINKKLIKRTNLNT